MKVPCTKMYDVIIVGAGPSGSTAALYAKRFGLKTLLLDKSVFPRDKICGDALSGKTVRILRDLDLLEGVRGLNGATIDRITFGSPGNKEFDVQLKGSERNDYITEGYVIPRKVFDNFLFKKAAEVVETREGFNVKDLIRDGDQVVGVEGVNADGEIVQLEAPIVMGADGPNSIVLRKMDLYEMDMKNTAVALRCYYKGVEGLTNQIELHYLEEVNPGYFWLFPAGNGLANIGIGLSKDEAKKKDRNLRHILDEVIKSDRFKDRFKNAEPAERAIGWNLPLGRIKRANHGGGYMLLGDAAGLVDPFTGEGIGNAMVSGMYASKIASKAIKGKNYSCDVFKEYDSLLWQELGGELRTSSKLADLAKYSFLLNFVINRAVRNKGVRDIISGMLSQEISKDELSRPSFYFRILFS